MYEYYVKPKYGKKGTYVIWIHVKVSGFIAHIK